MREADYKRFVGENLTLAREVLGLHIAELARLYGIGPSRISTWESGQHYPDPWIITRMCEDFGLSADWFWRRLPDGASSARADGLRRAKAERSGPSTVTGIPPEDRHTTVRAAERAGQTSTASGSD